MSQEPKIRARGKCPGCRHTFELERWAEGTTQGVFEGWKLPEHDALGWRWWVGVRCRESGAKLTAEWMEAGR